MKNLKPKLILDYKILMVTKMVKHFTQDNKKSICGRFVLDSNLVSGDSVFLKYNTTDKNNVTCKRCLKAIGSKPIKR